MHHLAERRLCPVFHQTLSEVSVSYLLSSCINTSQSLTSTVMTVTRLCFLKNFVDIYSTQVPANSAPPAPPPSRYYSSPAVRSFDFSASVAQFLKDIDLGPRALCRIAAARDYDIDSWGDQFKLAGLSLEHAAILQDLFIAALTPQQREILHIPPSRPRPSGTSVGTESSIYNRD